MLEADLDGGVLGARYGLGADPGVVSLIAAFLLAQGADVNSKGSRGKSVREAARTSAMKQALKL